MNSVSYPAVFRQDAEQGTSYFSVEFPDLPGCFSCGRDWDDACRMARCALSIYLHLLDERWHEFPTPTPTKSIPVHPYESIHMVNFDPSEDLDSEETHSALKRSSQILLVPDLGEDDLPEWTLRRIEKFTGFRLE